MDPETAAPTAPTTAPTTEPQGNPLHDIPPTGGLPTTPTAPTTEPTAPPPGTVPSIIGATDPTNKPDETILWRNDLPEAYREHKMLDKHTSMESLLKSHESLSSMIHEKGVIMPDENSTDEQRAAWRKHTGVPETAAQYEVPPSVQEMSDDVRKGIFGENGVEVLYKEFHDIGLTQSQMNTVFPMFDNVMREMGERIATGNQQAEQDNYNKTISNLKVAFGVDYETNLTAVNNIISKLGVAETLKNKGMTNDFDVIMMFHEINQALGGETTIDGTLPGGANQSFDSKIEAIEKDFDENKIDKKEYQKRRTEAFLVKSKNLNQI